MDFIISACTDIGISKDTNQDSLSVKKIKTKTGNVVFAILCDGMGGLSSGEVASASVIYAFNNWVFNSLPLLCESGRVEDSVIRRQWEEIITSQNEKIKIYGNSRQINLGTTAVVMLLTESRYYIMNVGDSRAYEIGEDIVQLTVDQTVVAREVAAGKITEEQARVDNRRSILLQCVGASDKVYPEMFFGDVKQNATYMICSDGFRHEINNSEIYEKFQPNMLHNEDDMRNNTLYLIELNKQRKERDNISVALVRTF